MKLHWPTKSYSFTLELDANDQIVQKYWEKIEQDFTANQGKLIFEHENFPNKYKNLLFHGDNQKILTILKDHIEQGNLDRIKCIYIDPPYNTGRNDIKYHDVFEHSEWLSFMFPRLKLMREVLREDGFLIVQLDDSEHAYLDIMLSEIFGEENKMASFIWRRRQSQANLKKTASTIHDYILIYGKNKNMVKKLNFEEYILSDTKKYGHNQLATKEINQYFKNKTIFDTPKPELLLYYLLNWTTEKDDIIMDCFAGSGTTLAAAHKMKRKWIGIEVMQSSIDLIKSRIDSIINLKEKTQLDEKLQWNGGGQFEIARFFDEEQNQINNNQSIEFQKKEIYFTIESHKKQKSLDGYLNPIKTYQTSKIPENKEQFQSIIIAPSLEFQEPNGKILSRNDLLESINKGIEKAKFSLKETGFLVIHSIEPHYALTKVMIDNCFGRENHVITFIWKRNSDSKGEPQKLEYEGNYFDYYFDYIMIYSKDVEKKTFFKMPPSMKLYFNPDNDPRGPWISHPLVASEKSENKVFTHIFKDGREITKKWRYPPESIRKLDEENRLHYTYPNGTVGIPRVKKFYSERLNEYEETGERGTNPNSLLLDPEEYGSIDEIYRNYTKNKKLNKYTCPLTEKLVEFLKIITCGKNTEQSIVIDF